MVVSPRAIEIGREFRRCRRIDLGEIPVHRFPELARHEARGTDRKRVGAALDTQIELLRHSVERDNPSADRVALVAKEENRDAGVIKHRLVVICPVLRKRAFASRRLEEWPHDEILV